MKETKIKIWISRLIVILGIITIIIGIIGRIALSYLPFEWDEVFSAVTSNPAIPFSFIWKHYLFVDVHPPLYNFLLWLYNHVAPYGPELALRLPGICFSIFTLIYAWFKFPRRYSKTARWVFILLYSSNAWLIFFAQYARAYSWMFLLATVLTFTFVEMCHAIHRKIEISARQWWIFAIASLLLCWSHYFGALLFGLLSVALFIQAFINKRPLKKFILVPLGVFILFLPWMLPNLIYNIDAHRFSGDWWANERPVNKYSFYLMAEFLLGFSSTAYMILTFILVSLGWHIYLKVCYKRPIAYLREVCWLVAVILVAQVSVWFISYRIYWFIGRYFVPFMPVLFLAIALWITPLLNRMKKILFLAFFCVALSGFYAYYTEIYIHVHEGKWWAIKEAMQWYQKYFPDKELFVVSMDAFPKESLLPMYSFYPNHILNMGTKVTELYHAPEAIREQALSHQQTAILWMPNCERRKLIRLSHQWHRKVLIYHHEKNNCFFSVETTPKQKGTQLFEEYQRRLPAFK